MGRLTNAEFAQRCAYIAKNAAAWAGDSLTLPEYWNQPVKEEVAERFCRDIEGWLGSVRRALQDEKEGER